MHPTALHHMVVSFGLMPTASFQRSLTLRLSRA
jgi:hypothetical protein